MMIRCVCCSFRNVFFLCLVNTRIPQDDFDMSGYGDLGGGGGFGGGGFGGGSFGGFGGGGMDGGMVRSVAFPMLLCNC
jgi:hypothetical protein